MRRRMSLWDVEFTLPEAAAAIAVTWLVLIALWLAAVTYLVLFEVAA